jgi:Peptidase family S41
MPISRRGWLLGSAGALILGAGGLSFTGGGPRSYFGGVTPKYDHLAPLGTIFTPDQLRTELAFLVSSLRELGARPFAYTTEAAFDARYRDAMLALGRPMNARGFFLVAAPLFASLNDGHVNVEVGYDYEAWRAKKGKAFPLLLKFTPHGAFVETQTHPALPPGTRIDEIDGVSGSTFMANVCTVRGAQTPLLRLMFAAEWIRQYLYAAYGQRRAYDIRATLPKGTSFRGLIAATTSDELKRDMGAGLADDDTNYIFSRIGRGRVGYIDYRRCEDRPAFGTFLKRTFASIHERPIDGLVIDIRKNGGGDSELNNDLWSYVTTKPFGNDLTGSIRVSDRLKREYGVLKYNGIYPPPAWLMRDGSLLEVDFTKFNVLEVHPGPNPIRYTGPVYLLIGVATFSSALDCAQIAKDAGLATIVGQETGEPVDSTGEVYNGYTSLIGTGYQFTTKYFWDPKRAPGRGVIPDVTIEPTEADIRANRDPALDYAVKAILHGKSA